MNVYVSNRGRAPSGEYDLLVLIKDLTAGSTYPDTWRRHRAMNPGENYVVYGSTTELVNRGGRHQIAVELRPYGDDADTANNSRTYDFDVTDG